MQAIQTKYHGPTNVRGSRISATCAAGRVVVDYDHALNNDQNHKRAAAALLRKLGWHDRGHVVSGSIKDGSYVHTIAYATETWRGDDF